MLSSTPTRDRILDVAMELFSERGFRATSVTQIETAAGLTPGAGGIYHHFKTKDAVLRAGVERHLQRLDALRDMREIFTDLGDLHAELTIIARYILAELDRERDLLRVIATETRSNPTLMNEATERLVSSSFRGFAGWLSGNGVSTDDARAMSAVALGALVSNRLLASLGVTPRPLVSDAEFVAMWVDMVLSRIEAS